MKFTSLILASLLAPIATATVSESFERLLTTTNDEPLQCLEKFVKLSFAESTLTVNNLGNKGPEFGKAPIMLFEGVGTFDNKQLDVEVKIKDGFDYILKNNNNNGVLCHSTSGNPDTKSCNNQADFGQINLAGGNQETTLVFTIKDHATGKPVVLPGFAFSNFDIDHGVRERYVVKGWTNALYDHKNTEAYFSEDEEGWCDNVEENCLYAFSTHPGWGCDNPIDPNDLGVTDCEGTKSHKPVNRKLRSFMVEFENKSSWEVYFATDGGTVGGGGRNVVFAFACGWEQDCENKDERKWVDCTTGCKSPAHVDDDKTTDIGGDPHFQRWGREHGSFHGECDLVMAHSDSFHSGAGLDIHVRTTIESYFSYIETAAVRVGNDVAQFHANKIVWNGMDIAPEDLPYSYGSGDYRYTIRTEEVPEGKNPKYYQYYRLDLHDNSSILFKFYKKFLTMSITGHTNDFADSVGMLGDYHTGDMLGRNGRVMSDFDSFGFEWQVAPEDPMIFTQARAPQLPYELCRMPTAPRPSRRGLRGANTVLAAKAMEACANSSNVDLCVDDVLMTGDLGLAGLW